MAIIIDGWDKLPQNCYGCDLHNYHECDLTSNSIEDYYNGETREPGCPLKEVSENSVLEDIKAEIKRKANSGQWSDATVYGTQKAIAIIDKHISGK